MIFSALKQRVLKLDMEIGLLPERLLPRVSDLFSFVFELHGSGSWEQWIKDEKSLSTYGAYEGDQLYAMVGVHDFQTWLNNAWVPCGGIAAVASNPAWRGQGLLREVMRYCLKELHAREVPVAILGTDIPRFYERMGFSYFDWQAEIEIDPLALSKFESLGKASNYKMIPSTELVLCAPIHERWVKQFSLSLRRSEDRWNRVNFGWEKAWQAFVHDDGYLLFDLSASKQEQKGIVFEWVFTTEQAYLDGLALLSALKADYKSVVWTEKSAEHIFKYGCLDDCPKIKMWPGHMARVVNLAAFERAIERTIDGVVIKDPMDLTKAPVGRESVHGDSMSEISPGELIQLLTRFWSCPPVGQPTELHGILGQTFTSEIF